MSENNTQEKIEERKAEQIPEIPPAPQVSDESVAIKNTDNQKRGRGRPKGSTKKKLNVSFVPDKGDTNPPALQGDSTQISTIDYDVVASGLVTTIDLMMSMVSLMSRGKLEYTKLSEQEKKVCANALQQEKPVLDFMAKSQGMNHIMVLATFAGVFATKIKIKKPEKEKEKEKKSEKVIDLKENSETKVKENTLKIDETKEAIAFE